MRGRQQTATPELSGFEPIEVIGSGGYATVFLYQQQMPRRQVAVKVLTAGGVTEAFDREANVMAQVSAHPYIVSIYEAGVAATGQPYLVMEYYPNSNFLERVRRQRFDVAEVLRVGIQVASALETAHRAGILHHDIKPANILTSEYGRPGLTDFGIASTGATGDAQGVSIPWAPPEAIGGDALSVASDVYSLAATLYHLLAGRSPFAVAGGANSEVDLMARIERSPVPPIGRDDVPQSLERILVRAMSKDPSHRPSSVLEFARQLQTIETELRFSNTPLELPQLGRSDRVDDGDDDATRVRGVSVIDAQAGPAAVAGASGAVESAPATVSRTVIRQRPDRSTGTEVQPTSTGRAEPAGRRSMYIGAGVLVVVAALVVGALLLTRGGSGDDGDSVGPTTTAFSLTGNAVVLLEPVQDLVGEPTETGVTFTWTAPEGDLGGVEYIYTQTTPAGSETGRTTATSVTIASNPGDEVCIRMVVARSGYSDSGARQECVTRP